MTTNQPDRIDQLQALLADFIAVSTADRQASNERMTRLEEAATVASARMDRFEALVEMSYEPVQALLQVSTENQAMIQRLDAILERMVYREGRGSDDPQ